MHLKSLVLSGFKSFAKKSNLEFNVPITSIVGPNGSGKSNIAEAFRFVLGEQSLKSLRGKKGEDMIFNGGSKSPKLNRASVKVVLDNTKRTLNVDFPEVSLERVVHRDGINEYFVNGTQVRLRDIIELLSGAHIGASGHHIISQGEADKILNSNILERREMLEDALGLKIYQYKKIESLKKLEKTEENMKSVESLRRELAPHLKFLKKQVERVEKARQMKDELRMLYKEYFKREDTYIKSQRVYLQREKNSPQEELGKLDSELKSSKNALSLSLEDSKRSNDLLHIESKTKTIRFERDNQTRELGRIEGEILGLKKNIQKIEISLSIDENKTVNLKDVQEMADSMNPLFDDGQNETDLVSLKSILQKLKQFLHDFISKNKSKVDKSQILQAEKEIEKLEEEKHKLENEIAISKDNESSLNNDYLVIKNEIEKEKEGGLEAEKDILRIMKRQQEINSELAKLTVIEERVNLEEADFKRELYEAGFLVGREAIDFEGYEIKDREGAPIDADLIINEERQIQHERRKVIERIKIRLEEFGSGGDDVLREFNESEERDRFLEKELQDLEKSAESLSTLIKELENTLDFEFKEGVRKINEKFQEFFSLMFGGGDASLKIVHEEKRRRKNLIEELEEENINSENDGEEEETKEGIDIVVSLPGKRIKGLQMLSGGERALTSIALIFAMSQVNPPPFIILDETDAALDEANSRKYGDMIENLSKYSQLILITHNRETMSRAGTLYGVTMGNDSVSKLLSIEFAEALKVAK